ncbi:hypothetical protein RCL_jg17366.t2 [Rhizophagus clarus]|uniref:DUF659 domain-containing protein n=1 Tax=Rhizophagus clarus TaxID=94130 RepID=A0A8H3KXI0_9GLOM|nr:hypothetical protein RCL_jg17366.t2 [Rhizophagus clarus]
MNRKRLRHVHQDIVFLPCFVHQANLCVADVFKSSPKFLETSKKATTIVKYFNASSIFTKDLHDEQKRIYNKYITLIQPGDTRWNSYYFCYQSVLKNKRALKSLAGRNDFSDITVMHDDLIAEANSNKIMSSVIVSIINDSDFWLNLAELEQILYPFCAALNILQRDKARLYDVLHSFGYFMQCTLENNDENYKGMMTMRLVNRWKSWEQPLLILSFFLHPSYKLRFFTSNDKISHINLNKWAQYYFFKWFGEKPISMIRELLAYKENKFSFNESSLQELEKNPLDY